MVEATTYQATTNRGWRLRRHPTSALVVAVAEPQLGGGVQPVTTASH
jgi:hypothetical protein